MSYFQRLNQTSRDLFGLVFVAGISIAVVACVTDQATPPPSPPQPIIIKKDLAFELQLKFKQSDGSPVAGKIRLDINLDGSDFFKDVARCAHAPDPHMSATISRMLTPDAAGTATISFSLGEMASLVDATCLVSSLDALNVAELRIEAQTPGTQDGCQNVCQAHSKGDIPGCVSTCTSMGTQIEGSMLISGDDFRTATQTALSTQTTDTTTPQAVALSTSVDFTKLSAQISHSNGPDLQVSASDAASTAHISYETWAPNSCVVAEGCLTGTGTRKLLRFAGVIENLGDSDFLLGDPTTQPGLFTYSACHNHYHLREAMRYELLRKTDQQPVTLDDGTLVVGRKQGFCMLDMRHVAGDGMPKYNCLNQGLTSGWADIYSSGLDCQWIDVTGVPAGDYMIRITVNPTHTLFESDYTNNTAVVPFSIPPDSGSADVVHHGADDTEAQGPHGEESKPNVL